MNKNVPILKRKTELLIEEFGMSPTDALIALESLCETLRRRSSYAIEKDVQNFRNKKRMSHANKGA